jgi:hypothetical protein
MVLFCVVSDTSTGRNPAPMLALDMKNTVAGFIMTPAEDHSGTESQHLETFTPSKSPPNCSHDCVDEFSVCQTEVP